MFEISLLKHIFFYNFVISFPTCLPKAVNVERNLSSS